MFHVQTIKKDVWFFIVGFVVKIVVRVSKNQLNGENKTQDMIKYKIVPCPAPRMTRADKWQQRPCVMRYFAFCNEVRRQKIEVFNGDSIGFVLPMPESWSKKKALSLNGQPHTQTPDLDNLLKSLLDAIYGEDKHIHYLSGLSKIWGTEGQIIIDSC